MVKSVGKYAQKSCCGRCNRRYNHNNSSQRPILAADSWGLISLTSKFQVGLAEIAAYQCYSRFGIAPVTLYSSIRNHHQLHHTRITFVITEMEDRHEIVIKKSHISLSGSPYGTSHTRRKKNTEAEKKTPEAKGILGCFTSRKLWQAGELHMTWFPWWGGNIRQQRNISVPDVNSQPENNVWTICVNWYSARTPSQAEKSRFSEQISIWHLRPV